MTARILIPLPPSSTYDVADLERLPLRASTRHGEVPDEGDCGDGRGCGNDWDDAGGAARAGTGDNDVVVQVHASGFTSGELTWPSTWTDRLGRDRTPSIPGQELAGVVTALGYGTTGLSVGQRVFGLTDSYRDGTLAEYVAIDARNLAPLPGDVDSSVGASLPMPGLTAWQGLFEHGRLQGAKHRRARCGRLNRFDGDAART
jgi:Alcohol dehydrogenase GroES-like domain